jgi:hypothetical protein
MEELKSSKWWGYIDEDLQELILQSFLLMDMAEVGNKEGISADTFHDYSFVVFPASKAYEGFLKKLFLDLGFIDEGDYYGRRFRIGRVLNPAMDRKMFNGESVYDKMVEYCNGRELADNLWETWRDCRNLLFHWFPNEKNAVTFDEAKLCIKKVINSMDYAFKECKI